jgi:hypothetical protein
MQPQMFGKPVRNEATMSHSILFIFLLIIYISQKNSQFWLAKSSAIFSKYSAKKCNTEVEIS